MNPETVDPRTIWLFDSSRQILVYRDLDQKIVAGFAESDIVRQGWKMDGIRISLPRAKVEAAR
jgi:hypothetical protein